MLWLKDSQILP